MKYKIVAKYIKNINFNIPNFKSYFLIEKKISEYKINFDIKSKKIKDKILEIDTNLKLIPNKTDENQIDVSVLFSTVINFEKNIENEDELKKIVLVDVPSTIYPDLRGVLIFLFEKSGFKNINLDKNVNFQNLYKMQN
tara:strand:- start:144 stop:557 length:414 start_codon:yes stop_codon:yes gene_type:complete